MASCMAACSAIWLIIASPMPGDSVLGDVVTGEYKINYVRPAIGTEPVARATVLAAGRRQAVCECRIMVIAPEGEKLVAVAQGMIAKVD